MFIITFLIHIFATITQVKRLVTQIRTKGL
nr:MAG TPA: hypothetical protein [Caudoviricetes sp.]